MSDEKRVKDYFDKAAKAFDEIYTEDGNRVMRFLNRTLRKDMYRRFEVTMEGLGDLSGQTVLDIGCGSGRFVHACARQRARHVLGIDFAPSMIEIAKDLAKRLGVQDVCEFVTGDFMEMELGDNAFDATLAIGLFDYIKDPVPVLEKMNRITSRKIFSTFPVKWVPRTPLRRIRLAMLGCPVYFFSERDLARFFAPPRSSSWRVLYRGQIYVVESCPA